MALGIALLVLLLLGALALGFVSVRLALPLNRRVDQLSGDVNALQRAVEELRTELTDLQAAAQVVPAPPPLPRTRSKGGLDDLRQRLRAAHTESEESTED